MGRRPVAERFRRWHREARVRLPRLRRALYRRSARLRALPDFVIIGAQRCGTSSLYEYLAAHPDVFPAQRKEIHYFDLHHDEGLGFYRSHFPMRLRLVLARLRRGHRVSTGEATPYYLFHPEVPERMRSVVPRAKLIVLLRSPVERAFSHYRLQVRNGRETLDFADAVRAEPARLDGEQVTERERRPDVRPHQQFSYVSRGFYAEQLERWFAHHPRDQVLVLRSEDLFERPAETYATVLDFLGLRTDVPRPEFVAHNRGDGSSMPPEVRRELEAVFRAPNRRLHDLVGIDLGTEAQDVDLHDDCAP